MKHTEVSSRYASALYDLALESNTQDNIFAELRAVKKLFEKEVEIKNFISSVLVKPSDKEEAIKKAITDKGLSKETESFLLLLAKKNRLSLFDDIVGAYQDRADADHGVTRGTVQTTTVLSPEERHNVEKFVSEATGKKVILTYTEEPSLIGGLTVQVGSYKFDDTLASHLRRLKEELKRSTH